MLVLSRRVGERIRIKTPDGTVIWVLLVELDRNVARIGVEAPRSVEIDRENIARQKALDAHTAQERLSPNPLTREE